MAKKDNGSEDPASHGGQGSSGEDKAPEAAVGGEDESSTEHEGDDSHLHEDQKSERLPI